MLEDLWIDFKAFLATDLMMASVLTLPLWLFLATAAAAARAAYATRSSFDSQHFLRSARVLSQQGAPWSIALMRPVSASI